MRESVDYGHGEKISWYIFFNKQRNRKHIHKKTKLLLFQVHYTILLQLKYYN